MNYIYSKETEIYGRKTEIFLWGNHMASRESIAYNIV